ncbi:MAG: GIY-YIG nuclease family protein [Candidatus Paceibacterota bacterium]
MYFVYILKSEKDCGIYIGKTNNVSRRILEHNAGHTQSLKNRIPLTLLEYIECKTEEDARCLEKEYKKGYKREEIKRKYNLQ